MLNQEGEAVVENRILVLDDDKLVLKTVRLVCEKNGYEVIAVSTSEEAVNAVATNTFDLIISDIRMPGLGGIETIRKIISEKKASSAVVPKLIFMTGYASERAPQDAKELGAVAYLLKPFNIDELVASVKKATQE